MSGLYKRVLDLLAAYPEVAETSELAIDEASGKSVVYVTINVPMVTKWLAAGGSPNGVKAQEIVRFAFHSTFPLVPPEITLREDFSRGLAHIQPYLADGRPIPCLFLGSYLEIFNQHVTVELAMMQVMDQLVAWLERAAYGDLIDPTVGWEPARRDNYKDDVVLDEDKLRSLVVKRGGYRFLRYEHHRLKTGPDEDFIAGQILGQPVTFNKATFSDVMKYNPIRTGFSYFQSIAILVWPGINPDGSSIMCDEYKPETVSNIGELKERASLYGCLSELNDAFWMLDKSVSATHTDMPAGIAVILCARRPFNLIGSSSPVELSSYFFDFMGSSLFPQGDNTLVRPATQREIISKSLISRLGGKSSRKPLFWTLVGAGSLGSKIAIHLGRGGVGPTSIVDNSRMLPHNYARHGLLPSPNNTKLDYFASKAERLSLVLENLDSASTAFSKDIITLIYEPPRILPWNKDTWCLVNTTASLAVRESLNSAPEHLNLPRIIEVGAYSGGKVGMCSIEGPSRNPKTGDLVNELYAIAVEEPELAATLFQTSSLDYLTVGQGCGSLTMQMSDETLSIFASGAAAIIDSRQKNGLPTNGEIIVGTLSEDGFGMSYKTYIIPPLKIIAPSKDSHGWSVRIHDRAVEKMRADIAQYTTVETGGVLVGKISDVSKTMSITDIIDAPPDSSRSAAEFKLGVQGLSNAIEEYFSQSGGQLYCLGTWHSHLNNSGPSPLDRATSEVLSQGRALPSIMLICLPNGSYEILYSNI